MRTLFPGARFGTLASVVGEPPAALAAEVYALLKGDERLLSTINSVGLPVLTPDGRTLLRGPFIRIPETPGAAGVEPTPEGVDAWARKGWVDLRPQNFERWRERFAAMQRGPRHTRDEGSAAVTREAYPYDEIRLGAVVAWIFNNEILGYRIK